MKDLRDAAPDFRKAVIAEYEKIMNGIIKREYPDLKGYKATYLFDKDDFLFTGLTSEQEAHIRKLPK